MSKEFTGQVALVTGGSRGMGRAIALQLARGGADVAIGFRSRQETAKEVVREIQGTGQRAIFAAKSRLTPLSAKRATIWDRSGCSSTAAPLAILSIIPR